MRWGTITFHKTMRVLSRTARSLWACLCLFAKWNEDKTIGTCFPSQKTLHDFSGMAKRTIERAMIELEDYEFVDVARRKGRHNVYTLYTLGSDRFAPGGAKEDEKPASGLRPNSTDNKTDNTPNNKKRGGRLPKVAWKIDDDYERGMDRLRELGVDVPIEAEVVDDGTR